MTAGAPNSRTRHPQPAGELSRGELIYLIALFAFAGALRVWLARHAWVDPDEGAHLMDARLALEGRMPAVDYGARQPLYVYAYAWASRVLGASLMELRLLPAAFSLLGGWLVLLIGRRVFGTRTAIVATTLTLLLPFLVVHASQAKTGPMTIALSALAVYAFLRALSTGRSFAWMALSGAVCAASFYVRESSLAIGGALGLALVVTYGIRARQFWVGAGALASGFALVVVAVVSVYAIARPSSEPWASGSLNPTAFVIRQITPLIKRPATPALPQADSVRPAAAQAGAASGIRERIGDEEMRLGQPWSETRRELGIALSLNVGLIASALIGLAVWLGAARGGGAATGRGASIVLLWPTMLGAAYAFYAVRRGFFPAYFTEVMPPLALIAGFGVVRAVERLDDAWRWLPIATIGGAALAFFAAHQVTAIPTVHRPWYFVVPTCALALYFAYMKRERVRAGVGTVVLVGGLTVVTIALGAYLGATAKYSLYALLVPATFAVLRARATHPQARQTGWFASFVALSLATSAFAFALDAEAKRIDHRLAGVWDPATIVEVSDYLRTTGHTGQDVLSGAVIWEYEAGLRSFLDYSHPLGFMGGINGETRERIDARLRDDPPDFVIVDGFTEVTYLRFVPGLNDLLTARYVRDLSIPGSRFPTPVDVYRRVDPPTP